MLHRFRTSPLFIALRSEGDVRVSLTIAPILCYKNSRCRTSAVLLSILRVCSTAQTLLERMGWLELVKIENDGFGTRHGLDRITDPLGPHPGTFDPDEWEMIGATLCFSIDLDRPHL